MGRKASRPPTNRAYGLRWNSWKPTPEPAPERVTLTPEWALVVDAAKYVHQIKWVLLFVIPYLVFAAVLHRS